MVADLLYSWLGFGRAKAMPPAGFKGEYGASTMVWPMTWRDRLRVLISGKIMVDIAHLFDKGPRRWESTASFSVLPPNAEG